MECCVNNLGEFPHNEDIDTGIVASQTGYHDLEFIGPNFTGFKLRYYFFYGANIVIPKGKLNEDFLYTLKVKQPDGVYLEVTSCPNFIFKTFIQTSACGGCEEEIYTYN